MAHSILNNWEFHNLKNIQSRILRFPTFLNIPFVLKRV